MIFTCKFHSKKQTVSVCFFVFIVFFVFTVFIAFTDLCFC